VCSNTRQHTATHGNTRQHTATHGNTRQHTATHPRSTCRPTTNPICVGGRPKTEKIKKKKKSQNSFGITTWRTWPWFVAITSAWPSRLQAGSFVFLRRVGISVERVHFRPRLAVSADRAFSFCYCHCLLVFARVCCLLTDGWGPSGW